MKPLKILFLTHKFYPDIGGIEVNSEILSNYFYKAGADVRMLTWTKKQGTKTFPFPVIRQPTLIKLLINHYWADVVYENNPCLRLSWPALFFKRTSVIALRTWLNFSTNGIGLNNKVKRFWLKRSSAVIAVSKSVQSKSWSRSIVINNPYRSDLFIQLPNSSRHINFVFLGRLVPDKGADLAIKALNNLVISSPSGKHLKLSIIGDGPQRSELEELVKTCNLQDNVSFTGALQGTPLVECLNKHRFLLVPSLWEEPFGNVALEGMACGCIPIVSDGGGLPEAVGDAGIIFERGSLNSLISAMKNILDAPAEEQKLRAAAKKHLEAHKPEFISEKYFTVIKSAAKR